MSYHQQTSRAQYPAKVAAQPFYPLQSCMFPPFRLLSPVTFCLPGTFLILYPHTPPASVPCQSCCAVGHSHSAHRQGIEPSNAPPIRELPVWHLAWAALATQTLRAEGAARKTSPDSQAHITALTFGVLTGVETGAWCGSPSCPHTSDVVQHIWLFCTPVALAPQVLHVQLVLVIHTARLIVNFSSGYPRQDRGAVCTALSSETLGHQT